MDIKGSSVKKELKKIAKELRQLPNVGISEYLDKIKTLNLQLSKDDVLEVINGISPHRKSIGEYYTPNTIAKLIADLGRLFSPHSVIDICCGIGNILYYCDFANNVTGVDINANSIELAKFINNKASFQVADSLTFDFENKYDLIVLTPPFGMRRQSECRNEPIEKLFVEKALSLLSSGGSLICLVPNNFLTAPIYENTRKQILKDYSLEMILNLPAGEIISTFIQTSVLLIRNTEKRDKVYLGVFENNATEIIENYKTGKGDIHIPISRIHNRWDRNFFDPKFEEIDERLRGQETRDLEELAEIIRGYPVTREQRLDAGKYLIMSGRNVQNGKIVRTDRDQYIDCTENERISRCILRPGDILISLIFNDQKLCLYGEQDPPAIANHNCAIIRSDNNEYIKT